MKFLKYFSLFFSRTVASWMRRSTIEMAAEAMAYPRTCHSNLSRAGRVIYTGDSSWRAPRHLKAPCDSRPVWRPTDYQPRVAAPVATFGPWERPDRKRH